MSGVSARSPRTPPDLMRFHHWVPLEVRYRDFDTQGHVNNATYFTYFEQARVRFLHALREHVRSTEQRTPSKSLDPSQEEQHQEPNGLSFVVAKAACAYLRSITSIDPILVGVRCARVGGASFELEYAVCDRPDGQLFATGSTTIVHVEPETGRPAALPPAARRALAAMTTSDTANETSGQPA